MAGDEGDGARHAPVGQRNVELRRQSERRGDARHHVDGDAGRFERIDLLPCPPEDHRIAGLETHDAFAVAGERDHAIDDVDLPAGVTAGAFADIDALRLAAR